MRYLTLFLLLFSACATAYNKCADQCGGKDNIQRFTDSGNSCTCSPKTCEQLCAPDISKGIIKWEGKDTCLCFSKELEEELEKRKAKNSI